MRCIMLKPVFTVWLQTLLLLLRKNTLWCTTSMDWRTVEGRRDSPCSNCLFGKRGTRERCVWKFYTSICNSCNYLWMSSWMFQCNSEMNIFNLPHLQIVCGCSWHGHWFRRWRAWPSWRIVHLPHWGSAENTVAGLLGGLDGPDSFIYRLNLIIIDNHWVTAAMHGGMS